MFVGSHLPRYNEYNVSAKTDGS